MCDPVSELAIFRQGACRKRQTLVRKDKALSEDVLFLAEKNLRRSRSRTYVPCRLLSFFGGIILRKWKVDWTFLLRLSKKRQRFVGNNKALSETKKPFFGPELAK